MKQEPAKNTTHQTKGPLTKYQPGGRSTVRDYRSYT